MRLTAVCRTHLPLLYIKISFVFGKLYLVGNQALTFF